MTSSAVNGCWSTVVMSSDEHNRFGGGWVQGCELPEGHSGPHFVGEDKVADERLWLRWDDNGARELFEMHSCRGLGNTCALFSEHEGPHVPREGAEPEPLQSVTHRNGGAVQTLNPVVAKPVASAPAKVVPAPAKIAPKSAPSPADAATDSFPAMKPSATVKPSTNGRADHHAEPAPSVPKSDDKGMTAAILALAASIDNLAQSMRER